MLLLRRQSKGFVRTSSKFRAITKDRVCCDRTTNSLYAGCKSTHHPSCSYFLQLSRSASSILHQAQSVVDEAPKSWSCCANPKPMILRISARVNGASGCMSSGFEQAACSLQYMAHRLEPRNEPMHRRAKVLYSGSMVYGSPQDAAYGKPAEVQHAAHSLSGLGQVGCSHQSVSA